MNRPLRAFVYVYSGQLLALLFWVGVGIVQGGEGFGHWMILTLSDIVMALVLTSIFVLPAILLAWLLTKQGWPRLGLTIFACSVLFLVFVNLLGIVGSVFDAWGTCLGALIDGHCEVGPYSVA